MVDIRWADYTFEDPWRGNRLLLSDAEDVFRFWSPDGYDSGPVAADCMRIVQRRWGEEISVVYFGRELMLLARTVGTTRGFMVAWAVDRERHQFYRLVDPPWNRA